MQREYLLRFLDGFAFPDGAKEALTSAYEKVKGSVFFKYISAYEDGSLGYDEGIKKVVTLAQEINVNEYTLVLLYLIYLAEVLKKRYVMQGMDTEVWRSSMLDLKSKAIDCEGYCGIWGTKVAPWHKGFFELQRFGFEKLQFNISSFGKKYDKNGLHLTEDDIVLRVHIPRTGEKLDYEGVQKAYRQATVFFKKHFPKQFKDRPVVFVLQSWMLFDKLKTVLNPQSNFMKFCNDYDVFEQEMYEDYSSTWRVFYRPYEGDLSKMPQDTSLQRAYAKWIEQGEKVGAGWGLYYPNFID